MGGATSVVRGGCDVMVDNVLTVSTRLSELIEALEAWPLNDVLFEEASCFSAVVSSGIVLDELPAPTASLSRLYRPLRPWCTRSPAAPLLSEAGAAPGGGAKSLKVVRESHWLAEVCILSRVWASCSLSAMELTEMEFMESRRVLRGELTDPEAGESDVSLEALLAMMVYYRRTADNRQKLGLSSGSVRCGAGSWDDRA